MTLFELPRPAVPRFNGFMLRDRGMATGDSVHDWPSRIRTARVVADWIHLGDWCDRLAYAELLPDPVERLRAARERRLETIRDAGLFG